MFMYLRVTDWKYREWLARFGKAKILKLCLKNTFRELLPKEVFRFSKNLKSEKFAKSENVAFCLIKYAENTWKIDNVLGVRIETIYKTRIRGKLSKRSLPFFYLKIGIFNFFKYFVGFCRLSKNCLLKPLIETAKIA